MEAILKRRVEREQDDGRVVAQIGGPRTLTLRTIRGGGHVQTPGGRREVQGTKSKAFCKSRSAVRNKKGRHKVIWQWLQK